MKKPSLQYEQYMWRQGFRHVAGIDEVGRGSWAGPVVAAAVILPVNFTEDTALSGHPVHLIRDSKTLSSAQRRKIAEYIIHQSGFSYAIAEATVIEINTLGIAKATFLAMERAIRQISIGVDYVLVDGFRHPYLSIPQQPIIKGDSLSISIAAASIIAKEYRDNLMCQLGVDYPEYGFEKHKGYGTKIHQQAIHSFGLSHIHRINFQLKCLAK